MKKLLMRTSALVSVLALASAAQADGLKMTVKGSVAFEGIFNSYSSYLKDKKENLDYDHLPQTFYITANDQTSTLEFDMAGSQGALNYGANATILVAAAGAYTAPKNPKGLPVATGPNFDLHAYSLYASGIKWGKVAFGATGQGDEVEDGGGVADDTGLFTDSANMYSVFAKSALGAGSGSIGAVPITPGGQAPVGMETYNSNPTVNLLSNPYLTAFNYGLFVFTPMGTDGHANKVSYTSPMFHGVKVGLTYTPRLNGKNKDFPLRSALDGDNFSDFGNSVAGMLSYDGTLKGVGVNAAVAVTYAGFRKNETKHLFTPTGKIDETTYNNIMGVHAGTTISYAGGKLALGVVWDGKSGCKSKFPDGTAVTWGLKDCKATMGYNAGLSYGMGQFTLSGNVQYMAYSPGKAGTVGANDPDGSNPTTKMEAIKISRMLFGISGGYFVNKEKTMSVYASFIHDAAKNNAFTSTFIGKQASLPSFKQRADGAASAFLVGARVAM